MAQLLNPPAGIPAMPNRRRRSLSIRRRAPVFRFVTAAGIIITLVAWAGTVFHDLPVLSLAFLQHDRLAAMQALVYIALASVLVYGSLVYLSARWGHLTRLRRH